MNQLSNLLSSHPALLSVARTGAMDSRDVAIPSREEMDDFLRSVYPENVFSGQENLGPPFVTLSYAQSLDGKIAGPGGQQILLSGIASMALTHRRVCILFHLLRSLLTLHDRCRLRELHEYILVGIGTVLADDPQLTGHSLCFPFARILDSQFINQPVRLLSFRSFDSLRLLSSIPGSACQSTLNCSRIATTQYRQYRNDPSSFTARWLSKRQTRRLCSVVQSATK